MEVIEIHVRRLDIPAVPLNRVLVSMKRGRVWSEVTVNICQHRLSWQNAQILPEKMIHFLVRRLVVERNLRITGYVGNHHEETMISDCMVCWLYHIISRYKTTSC